MYISLVHSKMLPQCILVYQIKKFLLSGISELCTGILRCESGIAMYLYSLSSVRICNYRLPKIECIIITGLAVAIASWEAVATICSIYLIITKII